MPTLPTLMPIAGSRAASTTVTNNRRRMVLKLNPNIVIPRVPQNNCTTRGSVYCDPGKCSTNPLVRRGRALARQMPILHDDIYLVGAVHNFCTYHKSLCIPFYGSHCRRRWSHRTFAIATGKDHRRIVEEPLSFRVHPPSWLSPKRHGRPSSVIKTLSTDWST